ncbi:MAG: glutamate--tRNA ligase [Clostridiales Family XIII bacterium]|jgi:glutamyl-tRNA synthetase|nr:glutamate--tRNA ligase [Clostridiales Family XIII bacterium]
MMSRELAELLFPDIEEGAALYEGMYPARGLAAGAAVCRLGPSPTGFIHLGNLYGAFVNERLAHQSGGVFFLRIEDTDEKREVEGAAEAVINSLEYFGIKFDEGVTAGGEAGIYGPYRQSERRSIYRCFVKQLVAEGKAYPCFLAEVEIAEIRAAQEARKLTPGIYGEWARYREAGLDEIKRRVEAGEAFVIRFKSKADAAGSIRIMDGIRGELVMPENSMDVVILKTGGLPTYHFAHVVDDHLMRTTHVIRGEEWLSSLPVHVALFEAMGWELPTYCHTAVLMKMEGETKRKLSKRKDPELSLDYYRNEGYHPLAVREYLLTIINSNFEEWRMENPSAPISDFVFTTEKMSRSGTLFDLDKLRDVSKEVLLKIPADELAGFMLDWAESPGLGTGVDAGAGAGASVGTGADADAGASVGTGASVGADAGADAGTGTGADASVGADAVVCASTGTGASTDTGASADAGWLKKGGREYLSRILDIGRSGAKPRKDLAYGSQILEFIRYFYPEGFRIEDAWPENVTQEDAKKILKGYAKSYDHADDQPGWFAKVRELAEQNGYAAKPKDYKKNPDMYKGHVGDVSTVIRIALTGRANSPDLWEIQQILGEDCVRERLRKAAE